MSAGRNATTAAPPPRAPAIFVGRDEQLRRVREACVTVRLVAVYGVGGVGKTAFMLRAAASVAELVGGRTAYHSCHAGDDPGSIARQVLNHVDRQRARCRGPAVLDALARAAGEKPLVVCLDDVHRLPTALVAEAVAFLATRQLPLWFLLGSRTDLGLSPTRVDHQVVHLGGLSEPEARQLWDTLERLYGKAATPIPAARGGGHSPFVLKHAFAGGITGSGRDPLGVGALPAAERAALVQLAAYRQPVPPAALGPVETATVESLHRRFLVEGGLVGDVGVHDLVREALGGGGLLPGAGEHLRCLEHFRGVAGPGPAPEEVEAEILYHAVAAGARDVVLAIVSEHAGRQRARPPVGAALERELAAAIDALAAAGPLPAVVRLLRARMLWRQGQAAAGYEAACAISPEEDPHASLDQGEAAYCLGALAEAVPRLERAFADESLPLPARLWAALILVEARLRRGEVAHARRTVTAAGVLVAPLGPVAQVAHHLMLGFLRFAAADYRAAASEFQAACGMGPLFPVIEWYARAAAVAAGAPRDDLVGLDAHFMPTLMFRVRARLLRAQEHLWRGEPRQAWPLARAARDEAVSAGYGGLALWAFALVAEAAASRRCPGRAATRLRRELERRGGAGDALAATSGLALARAWLAAGAVAAAADVARGVAGQSRAPRAVRALADQVVELCAASAGRAGAGPGGPTPPRALDGIDVAEWRVGRAELLLWRGRLEEALDQSRAAAAAAAAAGWQQVRCRARLQEAEALCRLGQVPAARRAWAEARAAAVRGGYGQERLRAGLVGALLARLRGDEAGAARRLARVAERAQRHGYGMEAAAAAARAARDGGPGTPDDPGRRLAARLDLLAPFVCRLREPGGAHPLTAAMAATLDDSRWPLFIDLVGGRVVVGRRRVSLTRYPVQLAALALLARAPGTVVPVAELVRELWGLTYHRVRHHSRVVVAIARLRRTLGAGAVAAADGGYRLVVPESWAVVEPLPPGPSRL